MKEILGNNLCDYIEHIDDGSAGCTYKGDRYEVWEVSDELFQIMCDYSEEDFVKLAGLDAWWRYAEGCSIESPFVSVIVNGHPMTCWWFREEPEETYEDLSDYLCNYVGASTERNVCACTTDLAKMNGLSLAELFSKYEGVKSVKTSDIV